MKNPTAAKIRRIVRAIERQDLGELGSLLETEVKINQEISRGGTEKRVTMLSIAAGESALAMVRYLLDRGADPDKGKFLPPLIAAVQRDSLKVAELLVEAGANVNITAKFNGDPSPDYDRDSEWTPLMSAVVVGNTVSVTPSTTSQES